MYMFAPLKNLHLTNGQEIKKNVFLLTNIDMVDVHLVIL